MLMTFLIGVAAGWIARHAEGHVKSALEGVMLADNPLSARELSMVTLAACMTGGAILAWIAGDGSALALTLGASAGVMGPRLIRRIQNRDEPDYDT